EGAPFRALVVVALVSVAVLRVTMRFLDGAGRQRPHGIPALTVEPLLVGIALIFGGVVTIARCFLRERCADSGGLPLFQHPLPDRSRPGACALPIPVGVDEDATTRSRPDLRRDRQCDRAAEDDVRDDAFFRHERASPVTGAKIRAATVVG